MRVRPALAPLLIVIAALLGIPDRAAAEGAPRRTDHGDLIVLDVYGSYREMGAQIGELLGDDLRRVFDMNRAFYTRTRTGGLGGWLFDRLVLPTAALFLSSDTGVEDEVAGYAEALDVSRAEVLRALIGTSVGGSTVFAATRGATADGRALLGRNVDWIDFGGLLVPIVIHYHPDNGDLDHLSAGWPMLQIPTVGLNEAGLAFSLNYFATTPQEQTTATSYPYRRVLQRARNVEEAIALFQADFPLVLPCFGVLADARGDLALLECTTTACAVRRPEGDWFAHANHATSEAMIPLDEYRAPDSFDRKRLMEAAVRPHVGRLDASRAADIVRSRDGHPYPNASVVANLFVLNSAIVEPSKRLLWHSDRQQPDAPFGRFVPIPVGAPAEADDATPAPIPASALLASDSHREELRAIRRVRAARNAQHVAGDLERANALWAEFFAAPSTRLDLAALAIGAAQGLLHAGRFDDARALLEARVGADAGWEVRLYAAVLRGAAEDGRGDREAARAHYAAALAQIEARPEYTAYDRLAALLTEGAGHRLAAEEVDLGLWTTGVPP